MSEATVNVPPPASVNRTRGERWGATYRRKKQLQEDLHFLLVKARVPRPIPSGRVHATAVVHYPVIRRRDEGNVRAPLEKALADTLVQGGWLPDDTPEHFTFGELAFEVQPGPPMAQVRLSWGA